MRHSMFKRVQYLIGNKKSHEVISVLILIQNWYVALVYFFI
jgi:hypothetical protein